MPVHPRSSSNSGRTHIGGNTHIPEILLESIGEAETPPLSCSLQNSFEEAPWLSGFLEFAGLWPWFC